MAGCLVIDLYLCAIFVLDKETKIPIFSCLQFKSASEMRQIEVCRKYAMDAELTVEIFSTRFNDRGDGIEGAKQQLLKEAKKRKNLNWIWGLS